jgi:hypothetical protein
MARKSKKVNGITLPTSVDPELASASVKELVEQAAANEPEVQTLEAQIEAEAKTPAGQVESKAEDKADDKAGTVKLVLPAGTKETKQYLITPRMGKRERWFEKKRLTSYAKVGTSWEITLPTRAVKDRGILEMAAN